jgi:hypothetical protein
MGLLLGNACTTREECYSSVYYSRFTAEFLFTRGFLDEPQYADYQRKCLQDEYSESTDPCIAAQKNIYFDFIATGANVYNIYAKCYKPVYPPAQQLLDEKLNNYHRTSQGLKHTLRCTDAIGPLTLLNANEYRAELKVEDNNKTLFWTPCSDVIGHLCRH